MANRQPIDSPPDARGTATVPVTELLRLADRIEREHADGRFCACCSTDAIHLRDLARRAVTHLSDGAK